MQDIGFRPADAADSDLLADLVLGDPEQETTRVHMRLFGLSRFEDARLLLRLYWRAGSNWKEATVAELDGEPVGMLQTARPSVRVTPALVLAAIRRLPPLTVARLPGRLRLQRRVAPEMPPGAYVISEIHVAPASRGRGLGESIMSHAEADARRRGFREMALHTLTTNPARRFYERCGFHVLKKRVDPKFERITGAEGNLLMVKRLE